MLVFEPKDFMAVLEASIILEYAEKHNLKVEDIKIEKRELVWKVEGEKKYRKITNKMVDEALGGGDELSASFDLISKHSKELK